MVYEWMDAIYIGAVCVCVYTGDIGSEVKCSEHFSSKGSK